MGYKIASATTYSSLKRRSPPDNRVGRPGLIEGEPDVINWVFSFVAIYERRRCIGREKDPT